MTLFRKTLLTAAGICVLLGVFIAISSHAVDDHSSTRQYSRTDDIPYNKVGLLLGTAQKAKSGRTNLFFTYRIKAAAELYHAGKVEYLLVSGDNGIKSYNEPEDMQNALIQQGVPENRIVLDFAGFRTLDSVVRAKKVFGQESLTIISQPFHTARALYLAKQNGIDAVGYTAKDVNTRRGKLVLVREKLARCKMMIDILFGVDPKFLGPEIQIG